MVVYLDVLFGTNALMDYITLLAAAHLGGVRVKRLRLLLAAGLGGWMKKVGPPQNILYEYRRLGGERISIGSDSHTLDTVGRGVADCVRNARDAGFTSVTVFRGRRPEQVQL